MFTGLVQELGTVAALEPGGGGVRLRVDAPGAAAELSPGDSVSVNGVCLTATAIDEHGFAADVIAETLRRSSLAHLATGSQVNLELALRASDRLGGHMVQGHVDGVGEVAELRDEGTSRVVRITADPELLRYTVLKGSIAIDGVSLTVSGLGDDHLEVSLIPETLERTSLGATAVGARVNLEVDVLAKYVERLVNR